MPALALADWPHHLVDPRIPFAVHPRFYGRQTRTDRWSPREVRQPWHVLYLVIEGSCEAAIGGKRIQLEPGVLAWWPMGEAISLTWPARFVFSELWLRLGDFHLPQRALATSDAGEALALLDAAADALNRPARHHETRLRHLAALLLLEFTRERPQNRQLSLRQRHALSAYVRAQPERRPALGELARVVDLSPDYFSRIFRATYGCTPRTWLVRERIHIAARHLRDDPAPVHAIADALGYGNVAQFCRQFRAIMGTSPGTWRRS